MPQSLAEAILRGLAGASEELGTELQENQDWNLQRGDTLQRFKEEREWRRQQAMRQQANADRAYNFDVSQSKERRFDRLGDRDYQSTLRQMDLEAETRRQARDDAENLRRWNLGYNIDLRREDRLGGGTAQPTGRAGVDYPIPTGQRNTLVNRIAEQRKIKTRTGKLEMPPRSSGWDDSVSSMLGSGMWPPEPRRSGGVQFPSRRRYSESRMGSQGMAQFADPSMSAVAGLNDPNAIGDQNRGGVPGFNNTRTTQTLTRSTPSANQVSETLKSWGFTSAEAALKDLQDAYKEGLIDSTAFAGYLQQLGYRIVGD